MFILIIILKSISFFPFLKTENIYKMILLKMFVLFIYSEGNNLNTIRKSVSFFSFLKIVGKCKMVLIKISVGFLLVKAGLY